MTKEIKWPITFTKCPNCGSERRMAGILAEQEKEKGKMRENVQAAAFGQQSIIVDPTRIWLSAPALITLYDVCADCGTVYCIHGQLGTATPPSGAQKGGRNIPGFPQTPFSLS